MAEPVANEAVLPTTEEINSNGGTGEAHNAILAEKALPKVGVKVIVKQPKVDREVKEKKPLTEGQKKALEKMNEARKAKRALQAEEDKKRVDSEKALREEAVKKAEEEAKKVADTVIVQKVRGRKAGTKNAIKPVQHEMVKPNEPATAPVPLSRRDYLVGAFRQRGYDVPDDASPYYLKLLQSRLR